MHPGEFSVVDFGCGGQQFKASDLIFSHADHPTRIAHAPIPLPVLLRKKIVLRAYQGQKDDFWDRGSRGGFGETHKPLGVIPS